MKKGIFKLFTEWDVQLMAWHEAGHVVCSFFLPETEAIQSVAIIPQNNSFAATKNAPRKKKNLTYISCLNEISVAMAGRLSEEIFQKEITSSCVHDLNKIQFIALHMVCQWGMGKRTGMISWMTQNVDEKSLFLFSEKQREDIYEDIKEILKAAEKKAREILKQNSDKVSLIASQLLKQKKLCAEELSTLLSPHNKRQA